MTRPSRREVMDRSQCFRSSINPESEIAGIHVGLPTQRSHHNGWSLKPFTVSIHQHWLRCWHPGDRHDGQIVELCPGLAALSGVDLQNEGLLVQPKEKVSPSSPPGSRLRLVGGSLDPRARAIRPSPSAQREGRSAATGSSWPLTQAPARHRQ